MKLIIVAVIIAILVIVIIKLRKRKRQAEYDALRERVHNSGIIKELTDCLQSQIAHNEMDWLYKQINYYDDCDRLINVFDNGIGFAMGEGDDWKSMLYIDFVDNLGYKPLLDNGLLDGTKYITIEDIFRVFTSEVLAVVKKLLDDDGIEYGWPKYYDGFESQQQPDGSYKRVKVGDKHGSIKYKVPKSIGAKQM